MPYDAKTLPIAEQDRHFTESLNGISMTLAQLTKSEPYLGKLTRECVLKIVDRTNSLTPGEATEMLEGLTQLLYTLSARCDEVRFLLRFMFDPEFIPVTTLAKIIKHDEFNGVTRNLAEQFCSVTPRHLFDPEE